MSKPTCVEADCGRAVRARGMCTVHWKYWRLETADPCVVAECGRPSWARGYCNAHYIRVQRQGDPGSAPVRMPMDPHHRDKSGRKRCSRCRLWSPVTDYFNRSDRPDGLDMWCRRCHKDSSLQKLYGVSIAQYEAMLTAQNGVCAVCGGVNDGMELCVDHDHSTGAVRGLLCTPCNRGIGYFRDTVAHLEAAVAYLKNHETQRE